MRTVLAIEVLNRYVKCLGVEMRKLTFCSYSKIFFLNLQQQTKRNIFVTFEKVSSSREEEVVCLYLADKLWEGMIDLFFPFKEIEMFKYINLLAVFFFVSCWISSWNVFFFWYKTIHPKSQSVKIQIQSYHFIKQ